MNKISVIIPTLDEEKFIKNAILSAKKISSDIVVVDSGSEDKTLLIAKGLGAKTFINKFVDFASQRNFANSKTKHDWVFSMDADEQISDKLAKEINNLKLSDKIDGYLVPRLNIIFGKKIYYTRWYPDRHIWLYNKRKGRWSNQLHEEFKLANPERLGVLHESKIHNSHDTITDFLTMTNKYTSSEAQMLFAKGVRYSVFLHMYYPIRSFLGRFILKSGYKDGMHGFVLSVLMAGYRFLTWSKLWEKRRKS